MVCQGLPPFYFIKKNRELHLFIICVDTLYVWGQSCRGEHTSQELVGRGSWVQKGLAVKPFTL